MSTNFPTSLDSHAALVDNTDNIVAAHPNDRGDGIEATQAKVGVDGSAVATAHDYIFTHLPGQVQNWDIGSYEFRSQTLYLDKATGTAPMTITSTTKVSNLNVDQLDGAHASATPTANYIVIADAQGFIHTPSSAPDADYEVANKKYVDDALVGQIVQVVNTQTGTYSALATTIIPKDNTIPQNDEGSEAMTLAITPTSATNKLKIDIVAFFGHASSTIARGTGALFQDATANALAASGGDAYKEQPLCANFTHYMTAGTVSETTFKVRLGWSASEAVKFNGNESGALYGGVLASSITISEIKV